MTAQLAPEGQPMTRRTKVLVGAAGGLVLLSMLVTAVFSFLLAPPKRVLVVTMEQSATQQDRVELKVDCGTLPGVKVVEDQGDPDASVQGRFPVRFDIAALTSGQETALYTCINEHSDTVRGFLSEGDR